MSPETTELREGFVHPYVVDAAVDQTRVKLLVRDFLTGGLAEKETWLRSLAAEVVAGCAGRIVAVQVEESYRNMREVIDQHPLSSSTRARRSGGRAAAGAADSRRHRRIAAVVHGTADAEHLCRRAELPLAAGVGVGAGHGEGG